ncbi:hypothetical protein BBD46_14205 [Natrialba sp. SSL1]|nr:hypothetical protein BBD46_14205 [Natrialba sp. SSL1]
MVDRIPAALRRRRHGKPPRAPRRHRPFSPQSDETVRRQRRTTSRVSAERPFAVTTEQLLFESEFPSVSPSTSELEPGPELEPGLTPEFEFESKPETEPTLKPA